MRPRSPVTARQTRLGFKLTRGQVKGRLEVDFYGASPENKNALLLRYALLAIPLILAVRSDRFNFPATAVGVFMVQLVIIIEHGSRLIFAAVKH